MTFNLITWLRSCLSFLAVRPSSSPFHTLFFGSESEGTLKGSRGWGLVTEVESFSARAGAPLIESSLVYRERWDRGGRLGEEDGKTSRFLAVYHHRDDNCDQNVFVSLQDFGSKVASPFSPEESSGRNKNKKQKLLNYKL